MKKKLLFVISLCAATMGFAYDFQKDDVHYNITSIPNLTKEVTKGDNDYNVYLGNVIVPEGIEYSGHMLKVTCVGKDVFRRRNQLNSVNQPYLFSPVKGVNIIGKSDRITIIVIFK